MKRTAHDSGEEMMGEKFTIGQKVRISNVVLPDEYEPHPRAGEVVTIAGSWPGDMTLIRTGSGHNCSIYTARLEKVEMDQGNPGH